MFTKKKEEGHIVTNHILNFQQALVCRNIFIFQWDFPKHLNLEIKAQNTYFQ